MPVDLAELAVAGMAFVCYGYHLQKRFAHIKIVKWMGFAHEVFGWVQLVLTGFLYLAHDLIHLLGT